MFLMSSRKTVEYSIITKLVCSNILCIIIMIYATCFRKRFYLPNGDEEKPWAKREHLDWALENQWDSVEVKL